MRVCRDGLSVKDLRDWWPVLVGVLVAGIWLGMLNARVGQLESEHRYEHGAAYPVPPLKGQ